MHVHKKKEEREQEPAMSVSTMRSHLRRGKDGPGNTTGNKEGKKSLSRERGKESDRHGTAEREEKEREEIKRHEERGQSNPHLLISFPHSHTSFTQHRDT